MCVFGWLPLSPLQQVQSQLLSVWQGEQLHTRTDSHHPLHLGAHVKDSGHLGSKDAELQVTQSEHNPVQNSAPLCGKEFFLLNFDSPAVNCYLLAIIYYYY